MKTITTLILFFASLTFLNAQNAIERMTKETCKCLEKNSKKKSEADCMSYCFEKAMLDNIVELREYYKVQSITEIDLEELGNRIHIKLIKDCAFAYRYVNADSLLLSQNLKRYTTDRALVCDKLRMGKFYYLTPNPSNSLDTTHVTIDDESYSEIIGEAKTYSRLSIKWLDNCKFQLTFIESNDPFKSVLSQKGDQYEYEIVQDYPNMLVVKMVFHGDEFFIECYKE